MTVFPVILCGGSGTRLWPVSQADHPKQFAPLLPGEPSLFENTVERVAALPDMARLLIVTGERMAGHVRNQLHGRAVDILLEPEGRDSGPAMAAAAAHAMALDPDAICVFVASDHHIPDGAHFRELASSAIESARQGRIVTFGIRPDRPETAYGYIKPEATDTLISDVAAFTEKPDRATAQRFMNQGYLWNSGNFIAAARTLLEEFDRHAPEVSRVARTAVQTAQLTPQGLKLGAVFRTAPKISVDYAVMEPTNRASVLAADLDWHDLGSWDAVASLAEPDDQGNCATGPVVLSETRDCYVRAAQSIPVAVHGVEGLAVIAEPDGVLVCPLADSQAVKGLADKVGTIAKSQKTIPSLKESSAQGQKWLFEKALPLWWTFGTDHEGWGFHESLDHTLAPTHADRRFRVQARQVWCFAQAGALGWQGPWRVAMQHGLDGIERFYRRDDGFYRSTVSASGAVVNDMPLLYDQAFMLLALAAADPFIEDAEAQANRLLDTIEAHNRHERGGFRENSGQPYQTNAHMHLFEASIAWIEASGGVRWHDLADEIATLAAAQFINPATGQIHEFYGPDWTPRQDQSGQIIEPGHLFEWAWLFSRWARYDRTGRAVQTARMLFAGAKAGVDTTRDAVVMQIKPDGAITDPTARFWGQTEWLKALVALGDDPAEIATATRTLWRFLDMPVAGLWQDKLTPDNTFIEESISGSTFYHIIGAIRAVSERALPEHVRTPFAISPAIRARDEPLRLPQPACIATRSV